MQVLPTFLGKTRSTYVLKHFVNIWDEKLLWTQKSSTGKACQILEHRRWLDKYIFSGKLIKYTWTDNQSRDKVLTQPTNQSLSWTSNNFNASTLNVQQVLNPRLTGGGFLTIIISIYFLIWRGNFIRARAYSPNYTKTWFKYFLHYCEV